MIPPLRQVHLDVSGRIDVTDAGVVAKEVKRLLEACYPGEDMSLVDTLVSDFAQLYGGEYPGYLACELPYHDQQHVLDVTLAMARLVVGYESSAEEGLGSELALLGIACALFHDAGYIRRTHDRQHANGAAYTRIHVTRGARFLKDYLPRVGLEEYAALAARLIHFTGYEKPLASIRVAEGPARRLGELLGTADLIAQMADADYIRKCRDRLYREFEIGGLAGEGAEGYLGETFSSPDELLASTPHFIENTIRERLDGAFHSAYRFAAEDGRNLYMDAIEDNRSRLAAALAGTGR